MTMTLLQLQQVLSAAVGHHQAGRLDEAERLYRQVLQVQPDNSDALHLLGVISFHAGKADASRRLIERSLRLNPRLPGAHYNMGDVLQALGLPAEACASYRKAIELQPDFHAAWNNLGNVLLRLGDTDEATGCYRRAVELNPAYAEAWNNLGLALRERDRFQGAVDALAKAVRIAPDYAVAHRNLGNILVEEGRVAEGIDAYQHALRVKPDFAEAYSSLVFALNYIPMNVQAVFERHVEAGRLLASLGACDPLPFASERSPARRLRVGYVSPDFRRHSVACFIEPVLQRHDRKQFEVFCYSDVVRPDGVTRRLKGLAGHWRDISGKGDQTVADWVRKDRIDILVDLTGHTGSNRLAVFARRPAPIQVTYLGYPNTTGLATMDYRITDEVADPSGPADDLCTERLVRLPGGFLCYTPLSESPEVGDLPADDLGCVTFGSFNALSKISEHTVRLWAEVVQGVPGARLLIKGRAFADPAVRDWYLARFGACGLDAARLEFLARQESAREHLGCYHRIDVALDAYPYNGTTTTFEALWMGVPVIAMAGATHASRVGASILGHLGLERLVAREPSEFVAIAQELAGNLQNLRNLRQGLRQRLQRSPLMDGPAFCRTLEDAYRKMWQRRSVQA